MSFRPERELDPVDRSRVEEMIEHRYLRPLDI